MPLEQVSDLTLPILAFYTVVLANFTPQLLGCELQRLLATNMLAKHTTALVLLFLLVVMTDPEKTKSGLLAAAGWTVAVYASFLMTTRSPLWIMLLVLLLLGAVYVLRAVRKASGKPEPDEATRARLQKAEAALGISALGLSVIGGVIYLYEKSREYGDSFDWKRFVLGTPNCRNFTPDDARFLRV